MADTAGTLARGFQLHSAGDLRAAGRAYREVLRDEPQHAEALRLLGALSLQLGHYDKAVSLHPSQRVAVSRRAILAYQLDGAQQLHPL